MQMFRKLLSRLKDFRGDQRGVTSIEFAIVLPILLLVLVPGSYEVTNALLVKRKSSQTATVLADLATQSSKVKTADWTAMSNLVLKIMYPYDGMTTRLRLMGVEVDGSKKVKVDWSYGSAALDPNRLPAELLIANSFYVMAAAEVDYQSPLSSALVGSLTFRDTAILTPRVSAKVSNK